MKCLHCLGEVKKPVRDAEGNVFCCQGCLNVYHLLKSEGLEKFYQRRRGWTPGPVTFKRVDPSLFDDVVEKEGSYERVEITLSGIRCTSCVWLIERFLEKTEGVVSARVNYATYGATILYDPERISLTGVLDRIALLGYTPRPRITGTATELIREEANRLLIRFGTGAFFAMQVMLLSVALYAGYFQGISELYRRAFQVIAWALSTPVVFYAGMPFLRNTYYGLKQGHLSMDTLITLGVVSAYLYSVGAIFTGQEVYFDSASMVVTLILLGRYIETVAKAKASNVLSMLLELYPKKGRVVKDGSIREVPIEEIRPGDLAQIVEGERVPIDGVVMEGRCDVDESMLTGEPLPVTKSKGDSLYAGTVVVSGNCRFRVTTKLKDTVLHSIVKAVEEAQTRKSQIQSLADRVSGRFVLFIMVIGLITFIFAASEVNAGEALIRVVSVFVVACPCALGLATPLAIVIGSNVSSKKGIVVKGGDIFEKISKILYLVLDKTGTATKGRPSFERVVEIQGNDNLRLAASLEALSGHPVAKALREAYRGDTYEVRDFTTVAGEGVKGIVKGLPCVLGRLEFLEAEGVEVPQEVWDLYRRLSSEDKTVVAMAVQGKISSFFIFTDEIREDAPESVAFFRKKGINPVLLSGDSEGPVSSVAKALGIKTWYSGVNPLSKAEIIQELKPHGVVMMVGDGINDAPALTEADIGVSMARATDIALESSDVVLLRPVLSLLPVAYNISRRALKIIRMNLFWAFSYNIITVPLAVAGLIHPIVSAVLMVCSSLLVVGNSLRLLRV